MPRSERKRSLILHKFSYAAIILFIYLLGRHIPLYEIDLSAYVNRTVDMDVLLMRTIGGDINQYSLFALGISPYMMSSITIQMISACRKSWLKAKDSPKKRNRATIIMTLLAAAVQAFLHAQQLCFRVTGKQLIVARAVSILEMVAGVMLILWLAGRNRRYGFGRQTLLIYMNIVDGILMVLSGHEIRTLAFPLAVSAAMMVIMLIMEGTEKRIPVQRISIHNIYADKNYLAIKLNPVGVMPVMFSTAFFMLPQLLIMALDFIFPMNEAIGWWRENLILTKPLGIAVYLVMIYVLTIGFSMLFIGPKEIAEQFLKGGDSIRNLHAGRDTEKYLAKQIYRIAFFSATVMSVCLGFTMLLQFSGYTDRALVMLPTSAMMLTGIWYNLYQEFLAVKSYDAYKPFI